MPIRRDHWGFSLMIFSNAALVMVLAVRLRVAPSDVQMTVQKNASELHVRLSAIELEQQEVNSKLDSRAEWMRSLTDALKTNSKEFPEPPQ